MSDSNNIVWSAAREYARNGIYVNPVHVKRRPDGKKDVRPVGLWRTTSSTSLADIGAWEQEHPNAGLLIDCGKSKLLVVDCDGQQGIANWCALDPPEPLWIVDTPGGEHWYYREHPDHPIGNDQDGKVAPHVDIRGIGGFVFAPPTTDGQAYWVALEAPDWTAERYTPDVVIQRMQAGRSQQTSRPMPPAINLAQSDAGHDGLVDDAARQFTREQAVAYVKEAKRALEATGQGFNGAINNFAMACAHFPWLVDRERCGQLMIKALGAKTGWTEPDRDDRLTINSAYSATEAGKSWVAVESATAAMPADSTSDDDNPHLSSPLEPMRVAREVLALLPRPLSWWRGAYYEHHGRHWAETTDDVIRKVIYLITENATYTGRDSNGDPAVKRWSPNAAKVSNVHDALSRGVTQIEGEAVTCMAMENGVLDPVTREMAPHGPDRFNLSHLPFGYDPGATCPEWLAFLESSLPGDSQAHETLAEWFGYVLSGRTDLHKIGVLVGPPRCGKGTISRVLKAMVGQDGWAAPTLSRLGSEFGLASLIGKSLAVMGDVRWTSKHVIDAVPIMLGVSGEDGFTVSRKHVTDWIGKLDARLMLMSNDAPVFTDASGALAGRMVYVAFHRSFLGREDLELESRLMRELPGILNWALTGLDRITKHGMFTQSAASNELREEVDRDSSPVKAWADDRCLMDPEADFTLEALLSNYRDWLTEEHMTFAPSASRFSRDLRSAFADQGVTVDRKPNGVGGKHRVVTGIRPIAGASFATDLVD